MTDLYIPKYVFLTRGVGVHKNQLTSFDFALRNANIDTYNLVRVSSILPPKCKEISKDEKTKYLSEGEIVHCVLSENSTNEPHRLISASIGVANPPDERVHGYLSEHHDYGKSDEACGAHAEALAVEMFASGKGIDFDPETYCPEKYSKTYKIKDYVLRTRNIVQSASGTKDGLWTTVIAAAVFIPLDSKDYTIEVVNDYIKGLIEENNILKNKVENLESRVIKIENTYKSENGNLKKEVENIKIGLHQFIKVVGVNYTKMSHSMEGLLLEDINKKTT